MTYLLNIDEAIDRKFLVSKSIKGQTEPGNIIHVMDAYNDGNSIVVAYRVSHYTERFHDYQDYTVKFDSVASFCKWAQPDNFIARNYENLSLKDIQHYIKIKNRSFVNFCLPIIAVLAVIVWVLALLVIPSKIIGIILGAVLTVAAVVLVVGFYNKQKKQEKMRLYSKISSSWGVVID
ncbi:MAG: hypothetical protein MJ081_00910 [Ruminococcus sp.]|nr:hypothetical protein [Ruminococcus sp.]